MRITRDVLMDLLPAFLAGECSADTRALVEECMKQDPDFARIVDQERNRTMLETVPINLSPELEKRALDSARALLRRRSYLLAFACSFSAFPFSFVFHNDAITWIMWRDFPAGAIVFVVAAIACWIGFFATQQRVKSSGL